MHHVQSFGLMGMAFLQKMTATSTFTPKADWTAEAKEGTIPDEIFKKACLSSAEEALACAEPWLNISQIKAQFLKDGGPSLV